MRYNPTVPPLLNRRNSVLQADVYKWWKGLQRESLKTSYTDVVDRLFDLFPDEEHYSDGGLERCRTCAVVGNSGNLLRSHYGQLIDNHDFIIRINKGPTKGYERDVGSKTTHRLIYPESAVDMDNSTHLVLLPFKIKDMRWLISAFTTKHITRSYVALKPTINADMDKVMILHPAFIKYVYESWLHKHGKYPSTGFITIIFALHICDEVNVFGFGARSDGKWHHYFDRSLTHFSSGNHGGDFENKTMNELLKRNKIFMYKGW
ncbi:CMP-N-acetylneuraminate-beta-galactosamide-alpha-2,3-sialyltransferase 1-like isoform X2 [Xyrauchen texanus]|nr:CMP-N-acetylneuraminate-beta-galactosamide-alpha-2,3-sialyltransferase 1-like isoform X2 [Xyrauchen texanus]